MLVMDCEKLIYTLIPTEEKKDWSVKELIEIYKDTYRVKNCEVIFYCNQEVYSRMFFKEGKHSSTKYIKYEDNFNAIGERETTDLSIIPLRAIIDSLKNHFGKISYTQVFRSGGYDTNIHPTAFQRGIDIKYSLVILQIV